MTISNQKIKNIAEEAVNKAFNFKTPPQPEERKAEVSYEVKAEINERGGRKPYYYERFYSLTDEAKYALNKAYTLRHEPLDNADFIDCYLTFSKETKQKHVGNDDLDNVRSFRTMAVYYQEKYLKGKRVQTASIENKSESFYESKIADELRSFRNKYAGLDLC
mgnify:CR=1 FL=1